MTPDQLSAFGAPLRAHDPIAVHEARHEVSPSEGQWTVQLGVSVFQQPVTGDGGTLVPSGIFWHWSGRCHASPSLGQGHKRQAERVAQASLDGVGDEAATIVLHLPGLRAMHVLRPLTGDEHDTLGER